MKLLLDTHTFLWWAEQPERLSNSAVTACKDPSNELFLSVASIWEIQVKVQLGKLKLKLPLTDLIREQQRNLIQVITITQSHVFELDQLPPHHRDPFDRILIAQSRVENLILLTADAMIKQYSVQVFW